MTTITDQDLADAAKVAQQEGQHGLNVPADAPAVKDVRALPLPFNYLLTFADDRREQVLVVDGHVVTKASNDVMEHYFRRIGLLERTNWPASLIFGIINVWGELPAGFKVLNEEAHGPTPDLVGSAQFGNGTLTLIAYSPWSPESGGERAFETFLRATAVIDASYKLKWVVHKIDVPPGRQWQPFTGL